MIVRDPSTGKYYIVSSPPSFYESQPSGGGGYAGGEEAHRLPSGELPPPRGGAIITGGGGGYAGGEEAHRLPSGELPPPRGDIEEPTTTPTTTPISQTLQPVTDAGWYGRAEAWTSKKLYGLTGFSEAIHERQMADVGESGRIIQQFAEEQKGAYDIMGWPKSGLFLGGSISIFGRTGTMIAGGAGTVSKWAMDKPITLPLTVAGFGALGYGVGFAVSGIGAGAAAISPGVGAVTRVGITGAGLGLGAVYTYRVGKQVYEAPTYTERGGILAIEGIKAAAITGGAVSGMKGFTQARGWWRTRGMPEDPILTEAALELKTTFPEAGKGLAPYERAKLHKVIFEKGKFVERFKEVGETPPGFHMAAEPLKGYEITRVLHISPEPSPGFLKVSGREYTLFPKWREMFKVPGKPTGYAITPTEYKAVVGREVVRGKYIWTKPVTGTAVIEPTGKEAYFKFRGIRIPVYGARAKGVAYVPGTKAEVQAVFEVPSVGVTPGVGVSKIAPSYGAMPSYPAVSPPSLVSLGLSSLGRPSKVYTPSYPSKPSVAPSITPPSYPPIPAPSVSRMGITRMPRISYIPSYAPLSYRPSITPSYAPSYAPSYVPPSKLIPSAPPPLAPWFPKPQLGVVDGRRIPAKQPFGYTPSFAGFAWGIKAGKIPTPRFGKFTGLEIRPIVKGGIVKLRI